MTNNTPKIYVGTYKKYNEGSLFGKWLELDDYSDKDDFLTACHELHKDEEDPELMFQDFENIPDAWICESWVSEDVWPWMELDEDDRTLLQIYQENHDSDATLEDAQEAFNGVHSSEADFCEELANDIGAVSQDTASWIVIDWQATWDCNLRHDYFSVRHDGEYYIFRRM